MISILKVFILIFTLISVIFIYKFQVSGHEHFDNDIKYVYWTGGYDSTFRICQLLLIDNVQVQPIYIKYNIDSKNVNDFWVRKNRDQELLAMQNIKLKLFEKFPYTKKLLHNTLFINRDVSVKHFENELHKLNLWPSKRKIHQYIFLSKYAYYSNKFIDIGYLGVHKNSKFTKFIDKYLNKETHVLNVPINHPLYYLKFPLFNLNKKTMCQTANKFNFNDILFITWSCWFPKNNKPCNKCPMCKERHTCIF